MPDETDLTTQRVRNPWGQGDRLRTEILDAAVRLLSELGGAEALTIRGVARAAGIAPASIYQHFADKAALVRGVVEYDYERLSAVMREADESADTDDVIGRVRAQMHAYCRFAIANPGHYRLMLGNRRVAREPDGRPRGPLVPVVESVAAAFERCERAGARLRLPSDRAAVMVFVGTHGRVALFHSGRADEDADRILQFVDELISLVVE
ncbi:TetR/AcrR family transcriptional regulator [Actinoallomurus iriomotensis]|uniref:TetR family transcriptional regulator n=1 Tax=Actinoallomurus iriomotensis TaxID=478107 RepID=A0A9W6W260_9ACTN|nr:TetR/AcrR family transcriptional regulator [Actinoallomurus iriomotensis]GLY86616.1 TetR family transcriptional regulator [Actinoallomurus iriomotensis]